jgi:hypothetical protein
VKAVHILGAIARATRRKLGTFSALKVNNFFLVIALIVYSASQSGVEPTSVYPFLLFLFFVLLVPLSSDPLDQVPPSRLGLWPITTRERVALRVLSIALSPVLWLIVVLLFVRRVRPALAFAFITLAVGVQAIAVAGRAALRFTPSRSALRLVPPFPVLIRLSLRQMLTSLDIYLALVLSLCSIAYRGLAARPDPAAFPILAILIALAAGSYAQCLFGRDLESSAVTRYRILPIGGRTILFEKGLAFLLVTFLLTAPVHAVVGLTYGFAALAFGHHASIIHAAPLRAWRFSGSRLYIGVIQGVFGIILAFGAAERGIKYLAASAVLYTLSLFLYGWLWDRVRL